MYQLQYEPVARFPFIPVCYYAGYPKYLLVLITADGIVHLCLTRTRTILKRKRGLFIPVGWKAHRWKSSDDIYVRLVSACQITGLTVLTKPIYKNL